jgi:hypothetical protein
LVNIPEHELFSTHPRHPFCVGDESRKEMNNQPCVSREMAERLKEAGYSAPEFARDGKWFYFKSHLHPHPGGIFKNSDELYAPTATELLPDGWYLKRYWDERPDGTEINGWEAMNTDAGVFFLHENPHDAAAMAWLWEKEKGQ